MRCQFLLRPATVAGTALALLAVPATGQAQVHQLTNSDDPLLVVGHRFVEARNMEDETSRLELLNALMGGSASPRTASSDFLGDLLRMGGSFEPRAFYSVGGGRAVHIVGRESRSGNWTRYQLGLDQERPGRIGLIAQTESREPPILPQGNLSSAFAGSFLNDYAARLERDAQFSGALMVVRGGAVVAEAYLGSASDDTDTPVTATTPMNMASGSKMFTSILIGQAVEEGRLHWDATVADLVPALRNASWSDRVTVRHLLTHTSGLADYWDRSFETAGDRITELGDFIPFFVTKDLEFAPGESAAYSNTNFIVLGLVIEALRGRSFHDEVRTRILEPAGMKHTFLQRSRRPAIAYEPTGPGLWQPVTLDLPPSAAGGASSTARDLLRFASGLRRFDLVSEATLATMTSRHSDLGGGVAYGLGFEVAPDGSYWGHGGRGPGVTFDFRVYPLADIVLVAMSNRDASGYLDLLLTVDEVVARLAN